MRFDYDHLESFIERQRRGEIQRPHLFLESVSIVLNNEKHYLNIGDTITVKKVGKQIVKGIFLGGTIDRQMERIYVKNLFREEIGINVEYILEIEVE